MSDVINLKADGKRQARLTGFHKESQKRSLSQLPPCMKGILNLLCRGQYRLFRANMATLSRQQPAWTRPANIDNLPPIHIYNSLTRSKTPFVPIDPSGRIVNWYACGPTVYDDAHLGHARNYITSDIIRRIFKDYFGFNVRYVMNITDVDDKIILRARQQYLLQKYRQEHTNGLDLPTLKEALLIYITKNIQQLPQHVTPAAIHTTLSSTYADLLVRDRTDDSEAKKRMHVKTAIAAARALTAIQSQTDNAVATEQDTKDLDDVLMPYLDARDGSSVDAKDHSIFTRLTKLHEQRFTDDMHALNVQDPDEITRVTEYGPQIVEFVSRIQENGFAYKTSSGVYFDVEGFERANNHYARLEPWNRNDTNLQADGEGAITGKEMKKGDAEKRSQADFALWKLSKPGEPSWSSPWGEGRPGWHIECSAMASDKLGSQLDIHSGGIDLAFPHHDNELAQSEAYWTDGKHEHQWVNYFLHMGHLSIAGAKMSKSLKNFTTIRDALSQGLWSSRGLRIVLLQGGWKDGIEITDDVVKAGVAWEDKVNNFFIKANDVAENATVEAIRDLKLGEPADGVSLLQPSHKASDVALSETAQANGADFDSFAGALTKAKAGSYLALCDSFNTAAVMALISELITTYNSAASAPSARTTLNLARWITAMVNMLGLNGEAKATHPAIGWSGLEIAPDARAGLNAISTLRDAMRVKARSSQGLTAADITSAVAFSKQQTSTTNPSKPFIDLLHLFHDSLSALLNIPTQPLSRSALALCDRMRDSDLWSRGIYLEDRDDKPALIRPVTRELKVQREEKEEKERQKAKAKANRESEAAVRAEKGRLSHSEMFKTGEYAEEFGEWDEEGMPTKDKEGKELAKSRSKKLRKDWERQKKLHEAWLQKEKGG